MRSHVAVALTEWDVEIKACSDVGNPFGQIRRDHGQMIKLQHDRPFPASMSAAAASDIAFAVPGYACMGRRISK